MGRTQRLWPLCKGIFSLVEIPLTNELIPHNGEKVQYKIFQHDDLIIDVERERVSVGGDEIDLTETEFRLLVALADSMGEMVKNKHLLTMIWGPKYESSESILEGTIRRLRTKIELDPSEPLHILTCENKGFMIPMS